jgi:hypothetical protein
MINLTGKVTLDLENGPDIEPKGITELEQNTMKNDDSKTGMFSIGRIQVHPERKVKP